MNEEQRRRIEPVRRHRATAMAIALATAASVHIAAPLAETRGEPAMHYVQATPTIATSGMPSRSELQAIAAGGYAAVINLVPTGAMGTHDDEQAIVERGGPRYVHIPVDFSQPRSSDYDRFARELRALAGQRIYIHCQMNMRASVFTYLYRVTELGEDSDRAFEDVLRIWQPNGVWNRFIRAELQARGKPLPVALD